MESAQVAHHDHSEFDDFISFLWEAVESDKKEQDFIRIAKSKGWRTDEKTPKLLMHNIAKLHTAHKTQNSVKEIMEELGYQYNQLYSDFKSISSSSAGYPENMAVGSYSMTKKHVCHIHGKDRGVHCKDCNEVLCKSCYDESHKGHDWDLWDPLDNVGFVADKVQHELERSANLQRRIQRAEEDASDGHRKIKENISQSKKKNISEIENHAQSALATCETHYKGIFGKLSVHLKTLREKDALLKKIETRLKQNDATAVHEAMDCLNQSKVDSFEEFLEYLSGDTIVFRGQDTVPFKILGTLSIPEEEDADAMTDRSMSRLSICSEMTYDEKLTFVNKFTPVKAYVSAVRLGVRTGIYFKNHHKQKVYSIDERGIHKEEANLQSLTSGDFCSYDDGFVYSDFEKKQIRFASSKSAVTRSLYNCSPLIPLGIHISEMSKIIFVGFTDAFNRNLTEKSKRLIKTFAFQKTELKDKKITYGEKDLQYPYRLVHSDIHERLCVIDQTSESSGRVLVFNTANAGEVIGRFDGPPTGLSKPFDPRGICIDSNGQILVTDNGNHSVHLLTPDADYQKTLLSSASGLKLPRTVTVSEKELWIGCQNGCILLFKIKA